MKKPATAAAVPASKTGVSHAAVSATASPALSTTSTNIDSNDASEKVAATEDDAQLASTTSTTTLEPPRRKLLCNPSAGDVHRRERDAPWRIDVDDKIRAANAKAKDEQLEKRRWALAKQLQDGLMHSYNINYGVAELAMLLKTGLVLKAATVAASSSMSQQQDVVPVSPIASHDVAFVQLLAAAEKYDLKQVVALLDKFPKGRIAASHRTKQK